MVVGRNFFMTLEDRQPVARWSGLLSGAGPDN